MGDWHGGVLIGFDLETTGTEPGDSRIVTAAVVEVCAGEVRERRGRLADPGIPIAEEASAIHGYNAAFCPRTPGTSQVSRGEARRRPAAHAGMRAA